MSMTCNRIMLSDLSLQELCELYNDNPSVKEKVQETAFLIAEIKNMVPLNIETKPITSVRCNNFEVSISGINLVWDSMDYFVSWGRITRHLRYVHL